MSIIYNTLNRLETDNPALVNSLDKVGSSPPAGNSVSIPVKVLAMAMMLVFAGTGLMAWYWNDQLDNSNGLLPANAGSQTEAGGKSDHQVSAALVEAQTFPKLQSATQTSETATLVDQSKVSSLPTPAEEASETGKQPTQANGSPTPAQSNEKTLVATNVTPGVVEAPTAQSKPASDKQQQTAQVVPLSNSSQMVADEKSNHQVSPVPTGEQTSPNTQSTVQDSETTIQADQPAVTSVSRPAEMVSETGKQPTQENGSSLQVQPGEKTLTAANVKRGMVEATTAQSKPASDKQQRTAQVVSSGNTAQPGTIDEAVERARLALSRGQYQQALAALEMLSPIPERRADFWLMKGSAHLGLGQLELADKAFASAQPLAPGNAQIAVQRAILKQEKGDHASALQILKDAATRHPNVPEIFLNQGYSHQALGAERDGGHSFRIFLRLTEGRSLYAQQRRVVNEWLAQFSSAPH